MTLAGAIQLQESGRLAEAEAACRGLLRRQPPDPKVHHALATILHQRGDSDSAIELLRQAIALAPEAAEPRINLGVLLSQSGRRQEALNCLLDALKLRGDLPELHNDLGAALDALGRIVEAEAAFRTAIALRPSYAEPHANLGNVLRKLGRAGEAAATCRQALGLGPNYARAIEGLAAALIELGELDEAMECYRQAVALQPRRSAIRSALLYAMHYSPRFDAAAIHREHIQWGKLFCDPLHSQVKPHANDRSPDRKLRIGYVSPDFHEHTVPRFITAAMRHHSREQFELTCYSDLYKGDTTTDFLRMLVERWRDTRAMKDAELEKLIREDRIDIPVDLRGHAADNRLTLFARRPAPIQLNMVGYFDTTGLSTMDYRITDAHQDPPGLTEQYHTERLVRIDPTCWCYAADEDAPDVIEPPVLRNGFITFGSLNKLVKLSQPCARLWAAVLEAVPRSRLLLSVNDSTATDSVRQRLADWGLPPDRIDLLGKAPKRRGYLERFGQIDIALDTFPFNGITTTCDCVWMGVPAVSLAGSTSVSRAGKSILNAAGFGDLATDTSAAFVRAATELVADLDRLRSMRLSMRQRLLSSGLMNHRAFACRLEAAYRQMWHAYVKS